MEVSLLALLLLNINVAQALQTQAAHQYSIDRSSQISFSQKQSDQRSSVLADMDIDIIGTSTTPLTSQRQSEFLPELHSAIMSYLDYEEDEEQNVSTQSTNDSDVSTRNDNFQNQQQTGNQKNSDLIIQSADQEEEFELSPELQKIVSNYIKDPHTSNFVQTKQGDVKTDDEGKEVAITKKPANILANEEVQGSLLIVLIILAILIVKAFTIYCPCFTFINDRATKDAIYILFREVAIVLSVLMILLQLQYYHLISFAKLHINRTFYCSLLALFLYTIMGFIFAAIAQSHIKQWAAQERIANDYNKLESLKEKYEKSLYSDRNSRGKVFVDQKMVETVKYVVMRLGFIYPVYLPPLKESFLRKDFDFASYLGICYGKTLQAFFNTSWISLFYSILLISFFKLLNLSDSDWTTTYIHLFIPFVFLLIFFLYFLYFRSIERQLIPQIRIKDGEYIKSEELNFQNNYESVDPFLLFDDIPQPPYLLIKNQEKLYKSFENSSNQSDEDEESNHNQRMSQQHLYTHRKPERTCCGLCIKESPYANVPNRHERLFYCGRAGRSLARISFQMTFLLSLVYLAAYIVYVAQITITKYQKSGQEIYITAIILVVVCPVIMVIVWILLIPQILRLYTIISNIEMMKDRELMERIIGDQKFERAKRSQRIFQVLKLIRRELIAELQGDQDTKDKRLRGTNKKHIVEAFKLCDASKSKFIREDAFNSLVRLCGTSLTKQESYILLKKALSQGDKVTYRDFSIAVEHIMNDVRKDPYFLVYQMLTMFFNGKKRVKYEKLQTFFGEFVTYFDEEDMIGFLEEVKYIRREGPEDIDLAELASLIRDDVESFPK